LTITPGRILVPPSLDAAVILPPMEPPSELGFVLRGCWAKVVPANSNDAMTIARHVNNILRANFIALTVYLQD